MSRNVQNLPPAYKSTPGQILHLRDAGGDVRSGRVTVAEDQRRAGDTEMLPRPPAMTQLWPVGGWTVVVHGQWQRADAADVEGQTM